MVGRREVSENLFNDFSVYACGQETMVSKTGKKYSFPRMEGQGGGFCRSGFNTMFVVSVSSFIKW